MNYEKAVANIRRELKSYIESNRIKSLVIGVSGGIDSCLCVALAKPVCDELGIPLIGRSLPMSTNQLDELERAKLTGNAFCTDFAEVNLEEEYKFMAPRLESNFPTVLPENKIRNGNLKARLRMVRLYDIASLYKGMVLSTDNYTELMLGFWTLHGDVGDYGMIQNLWKTEVYDMAEWLMNNEHDTKGELRSDAYYAIKRTIEAMATDGLGVSNLGDLGQIMPEFTGNSRDGYKEVDNKLKIFLLLKEEGLTTLSVVNAIDKMIEHPVIQRHFNTNFKRNNPINISRDLITE